MINAKKRGSVWRLVHSKPFIRILHLLRLIGFALGLLILLALFHLLTMGIPDRVIRQITARACENGLPLQIDSIQLSPHRGWVLRNVRLYSTSPDDLKPVFSAEKLYIFLWPDNWLAPSKAGWNVSLFAKNGGVSLGRPWETALNANHPFQTVDRLSASLHIDSKNLQLKESELQWGGIQIRTSGQVTFQKKTSEHTRPLFGLQAAQLANALEQIQFESEPELTIHFNINADAPEKNSVNATCFANGILWNEQHYALLNGMLNFRDHKLTLESLQIIQPTSERLIASGSFDLDSRLAELRLQNTLTAEDLLHLLPSRIHNDLARLELRPLGPVDFDAALGPALPEQLAKKIRVDMHNLAATCKDLTMDRVQFNLARDGDRLEINDLSGRANGGPLSGRVEIDLVSKAWKANVEAQCDPALIGTLRGGGLQRFIHRFDFPAEQPQARLAFSHNGTKGSLQINGTLTGKNFTCGGVPVETLQTPMAYSNRVLTLESLHATHGDKRFDGNIQVNFAQKLAQFDASSSFDPLSLARAIAPDHPTLLTNFTFSGPVYSKGSGRVDYSGGTNHAFSATLQAEDVSVSLVQATIFKTSIEGQGDQLRFPDASFQTCDGLVEGSAQFDLNFRDVASPYRMDIHATEIDFTKFLQRISTNDHSKTSGKLSGTFDFTADAKTGFWASAEGAGQVEIAEGRLTNLPLFGGFARLMPGLKFFSITTFFADYQLTGGKLRSENIQLGGSLLSAKARGKYSPDKGLNFTVLAEPLRQTRDDKKWYQLHLWGADALKWGTLPLFDLFDFKLEGPLHDPQWRMIALPKELYEIMRRDEDPKPVAGPLLP